MALPLTPCRDLGGGCLLAAVLEGGSIAVLDVAQVRRGRAVLSERM
jgi:hypothetical protein